MWCVMGNVHVSDFMIQFLYSTFWNVLFAHGLAGDGGHTPRYVLNHTLTLHTMDLLWEKFQWILPLYMKPINFQSKASVVCPVTAVIFIDYCLKKLNVFSQHIGKKKPNKYLNSAEQITRNWYVDQLSVLINEHTGLISTYQLIITAACTNTGGKMKGSHPEQLTGAHLYIDHN